MIFKFNEFIKEEFKTTDLSSESLEICKLNIIDRLYEIRAYVLSEITLYNGKIEYKNSPLIDISVVMGQFNREFTEELVAELKIKHLFRKINDLVKKRKPTVKTEIRKEFDNFCNDLKKL
jgi:hypothetical protein